MVAFARFLIGRCIATDGAQKTLTRDDLALLVDRHAACDWGELSEHDRAMNEKAVHDQDGRLLSAYVMHGERVYVITEDISLGAKTTTTVLLADEY